VILHRNDTGGIAHYDQKLSLLRSSDRGQTWLPTDAPIHVADIFAQSDTETVPGLSGVPDPEGGNPVQAKSGFSDVAVDLANGNLYAVWQDTRFSNGQYNSIAFAMSTDAGFTWSAGFAHSAVGARQVPGPSPERDAELRTLPARGGKSAPP
jgi:hypothetical protein